jgi:hypothetical protein
MLGQIFNTAAKAAKRLRPRLFAKYLLVGILK